MHILNLFAIVYIKFRDLYRPKNWYNRKWKLAPSAWVHTFDKLRVCPAHSPHSHTFIHFYSQTVFLTHFVGSLQELWTKDPHKFRRSCLKVLGIVYTIHGTFSIWYSFRMLHCTPLLCSAKFSIKCYWFFQSDVIRKWLLPFGIVFCFCVLFGLTCSRFWFL